MGKNYNPNMDFSLRLRRALKVKLLLGGGPDLRITQGYLIGAKLWHVHVGSVVVGTGVFVGCCTVVVWLSFCCCMVVVLVLNGFSWVGAGQLYTATGEPSRVCPCAGHAQGGWRCPRAIYLRLQGWGGR